MVNSERHPENKSEGFIEHSGWVEASSRTQSLHKPLLFQILI